MLFIHLENPIRSAFSRSYMSRAVFYFSHDARSPYHFAARDNFQFWPPKHRRMPYLLEALRKVSRKRNRPNANCYSHALLVQLALILTKNTSRARAHELSHCISRACIIISGARSTRSWNCCFRADTRALKWERLKIALLLRPNEAIPSASPIPRTYRYPEVSFFLSRPRFSAVCDGCRFGSRNARGEGCAQMFHTGQVG